MLHESYMAAMWLARQFVATSPATLDTVRSTAERQVINYIQANEPEKGRAGETNVLASKVLDSETIQVDVETGGVAGSLSRALKRFLYHVSEGRVIRLGTLPIAAI